MYEVQKFALNNIYSAPSQDKQYRFSLVRVTKKHLPVKRNFSVYNRVRNLPNTLSFFHTYVIGNIPPGVLNLVSKHRSWLRDQWVNVQEDMIARNFIMQFYDCNGVVFPRKNIYYSVGNNEILIAIEIDEVLKAHFDVESCAFMRVYSNEYFTSDQYSTTPLEPGIFCKAVVVSNNLQKVALQNEVQALEARGGKTLVYVNGYFTDKVNLNIPSDSIVEIVHDKSILTKETISISGLRTFHSEKDNRIKYLLYRNRSTDHVQYEDDLEFYISGMKGNEQKGLYYYQHKHYAVTNVTDKDFALDTNFVNNQATYLVDKFGGTVGEKTITLFTRRSSINRNLVYSSLKLHELYKLPHALQKDVISNTGHTLAEFRVEYLENSPYFKVVSANNLKNITKELATDAVGYNGVSYYFGHTPSKVPVSRNVEVPFLYRKPSTVYEYSVAGDLIGYNDTVGPMYTTTSDLVRHVEFIQGCQVESMKLYSSDDVITLKDSEYRIIRAVYEGSSRVSVWEDITDDPQLVFVGNTVTYTGSSISKIRVVYMDEIISMDLEVDFYDGVLLFPLEIMDDRGTGVRPYRLDLPFDSVEVFLNKKRLTYKVDFFMDFPNIAICNKTYLDYSKDKQDIHVRLSGFNLDKTTINDREIRGFVSHGTLTRNNFYDLRDDKVFSTFIDGKLTDRDLIKFSEDDNSVRISHPLNGVPYTVCERVLSIKEVTGLNTYPYLQKSEEVNKKISDLYNVAFPEPKVIDFNVIGNKHYLYSTLVTKIISDLKQGDIVSSLYTSPYNDTTIQQLINNKYKMYFDLDPIRYEFPENIVEIHPHSGNTVVEVNLFQFRFLTNLVRIITGGKPSRINLSGYVTVNANLGEIEAIGKTPPGGVVVL